MSTGAVVAIVVAACFVLFLVCGGVLVALLLPAVQSAREAARRAQCSNNLRQLGLAFHNYHDTYGTFPPAYIPDENGKPMHSWRVLILPYMEYGVIHDQYNFDEPWDSPGNQAVTNIPIAAFTCPSSPNSTSTETNYMVITGPGTVFEGAKGTRLRDVLDGTASTILVVEVTGTGTKWAEPKDLDASNVAPPFSAGNAGNAGSCHPGGMNAVLCDGSVRFISDATARELLNAMITRAGGERVDFY